MGIYVKKGVNPGVDQGSLQALDNSTFPLDLLPAACSPRIPGYLYLPQPIVVVMAPFITGSGNAYKYHNLALPLADMVPQMARACSEDPACAAFDDQACTATATACTAAATACTATATACSAPATDVRYCHYHYVALQPLHWVLGSRVLLSAPSLMTRRQVLLLLLPGAVALQPLHGF